MLERLHGANKSRNPHRWRHFEKAHSRFAGSTPALPLIISVHPMTFMIQRCSVLSPYFVTPMKVVKHASEHLIYGLVRASMGI